jgi:hypothetical protein
MGYRQSRGRLEKMMEKKTKKNPDMWVFYWLILEYALSMSYFAKSDPPSTYNFYGSRIRVSARDARTPRAGTSGRRFIFSAQFLISKF